MTYIAFLLVILLAVGLFKLWITVRELRETLGILKMRMNNLRIYTYPDHNK